MIILNLVKKYKESFMKTTKLNNEIRCDLTKELDEVCGFDPNSNINYLQETSDPRVYNIMIKDAITGNITIDQDNNITDMLFSDEQKRYPVCLREVFKNRYSGVKLEF